MKKILFITFLSFSACTVPRDSRLLMKSTKEWRDSPIVLSAYLDAPLSGVFLELRENGKFEHTSSGMLKSFEAGNWTNNHDTLCLTYLDSRFAETHKRNYYIDRETSTLVSPNDMSGMRLRIMSTKL